MTHTEQAIIDAIEGGWKTSYGVHMYAAGHYVSDAVLDPSFWQAIGKMRGWGAKKVMGPHGVAEYNTYRHYWHQFIDHLAEGDDYETALSKID